MSQYYDNYYGGYYDPTDSGGSDAAAAASPKPEDPDEVKLAALAASLGRPVEEVASEVEEVRAQIRAAASAPQAPNPDRLSQLLDSVPDGDFDGAIRAFDQAGYVTVDLLNQHWQGGRLQRSTLALNRPDAKEIYGYLDGARDLEDYTARLRSVGLTENEVA
jgi:hypothetical protein